MKAGRRVGLALALSNLLASGCAGGSALARQSLMIDRGQTKEDVTRIMDVPGNRQFNGDDEAWQYCRTGLMTDNFTVVWFYGGRVTGVTTYKCTAEGCGYVGDCSQGFRTIRWEEAPDRTIEVRQR